MQSACPCAPTPQFTHCVTNPYCPGARTEQSLMSWGGGVLAGTVPPSTDSLTEGKEGGCCVSDWWGQVCGLGVECCRTDILLAHPALSAARPQSSILALSELLIVLMNILEPCRNGSSGLGVWFQDPWELMTHSMTRGRERAGDKRKMQKTTKMINF